jgi:hypothetical protein
LDLLQEPVGPLERLADRIITIWIARTARWMGDEVADVGDVRAPLAYAVLPDYATAPCAPVGPSAGFSR